MAAPPSMSPPEDDFIGWPSPVGLLSGIFAVAAGQVAVIAYHYWHVHRTGYAKIQRTPVDKEEMDTRKTFWMDCAEHLMQPEGFVLLGTYLSGQINACILPRSRAVQRLHVSSVLAV